ncbi:MAG: hypothetical protein K2X38_08100 [Gemmataceae bacterium]|nr:hypothetical protein [Gemmataceae bacterium]
MRYEHWRPRMGLATTAFLVASLLGAVVCFQVPRLLAPDEPQSAYSECIPPHDKVHDLDRLRPSLTQIQRAVRIGSLPLEDAITTVDALVAETTLDVSIQYFPGRDRRERVANMTIFWAMSDAMPEDERANATRRINEQFRKLFGCDSSMPHVSEPEAASN